MYTKTVTVNAFHTGKKCFFQKKNWTKQLQIIAIALIGSMTIPANNALVETDEKLNSKTKKTA